MNQVMLTGVLSRKFEVRPTKDGKSSFVNFTIEVREKNNKNFLKCTAWGDQSKVVDSLNVGDAIVVFGKLSSGQYDKSGVTVYTQDVMAHTVLRADLSVMPKKSQEQSSPQRAPEPVNDPEPASVGSDDNFPF